MGPGDVERPTINDGILLWVLCILLSVSWSSSQTNESSRAIRIQSVYTKNGHILKEFTFSKPSFWGPLPAVSFRRCMSELAKRALVNNEVKRLILVGATRIQDSDGLRSVEFHQPAPWVFIVPDHKGPRRNFLGGFYVAFFWG